MDKVKIEHHIKHLQDKHRVIDKELIEADKHYEENAHVTDLKKQKLKLKDEIESLKRKIAWKLLFLVTHILELEVIR